MTDEQRERRVWWKQDDFVSTTTYKGLRGEVVIKGMIATSTIHNERGELLWESVTDKGLSQRKLEIAVEKQLKKLIPRSVFNRSPRMK